MHPIRSAVTLALVGVVSLAGSARGASAAPKATASSTATRVDDNTLKSRITARLKKNTRLAAREIDVAVDHGVVTLKGIVRNTSEKTRAARVATVKGVTAVNNEIVVDARAAKRTARKVLDATEEAAKKTSEKAKEIAGKTADKTKKLVSPAAPKE
jgi:hypothetical protein